VDLANGATALRSRLAPGRCLTFRVGSDYNQTSMNFESRDGRRLRLKRAAPALGGGGQLEIHDLGVRSIGVQHDFPLTVGDRIFVEFAWSDAAIHLACRVARSQELKQRPGWFNTGLTIEKNSLSRDDYARRVEAGLQALRAAEAQLPPSL
jgi:hypothetical protein